MLERAHTDNMNYLYGKLSLDIHNMYIYIIDLCNDKLTL